jgi:uncharacterized membrane protein YhaH (DUF805 family)
MNWYITVLKRYGVFVGRARRAEFWWFFLINLLITAALAFVDQLTGTLSPEGGYGLLSGIYSLAVLLPTLAVAVRRLHDIGRSGWWLLIGLIPVIGTIILLALFILDGMPGDNRFGPSPKGKVPGASA